jgi:hypothetical protein
MLGRGDRLTARYYINNSNTTTADPTAIRLSTLGDLTDVRVQRP